MNGILILYHQILCIKCKYVKYKQRSLRVSLHAAVFWAILEYNGSIWAMFETIQEQSYSVIYGIY